MFPVEDSKEKSQSSEQKAQVAKDEYRFVVEETFRIRAQVVEAILWHEPEKFKTELTTFHACSHVCPHAGAHACACEGAQGECR